MNENKADINRNRANVWKVYSVSELADLYGLSYSEINTLIAKEQLTAVYIGQQEQWNTGKARPRYFLPLTAQNEAMLEQREMLKRCYRYTKALEAIVLEQATDGEAILSELKEKNEINTAGDLFGIYALG